MFGARLQGWDERSSQMGFSSEVEQPVDNRQVVGSIPTSPTKRANFTTIRRYDNGKKYRERRKKRCC